MSFIVRQYLVDRLKENDLQVAFEDGGDFLMLYVKDDEFEIQYKVDFDREKMRIVNVVFTDGYYDYQYLFEIEKRIESLIKEFIKLHNYTKVERK